jgi:hypothetical protein
MESARSEGLHDLARSAPDSRVFALHPSGGRDPSTATGRRCLFAMKEHGLFAAGKFPLEFYETIFRNAKKRRDIARYKMICTQTKQQSSASSSDYSLFSRALHSMRKSASI